MQLQCLYIYIYIALSPTFNHGPYRASFCCPLVPLVKDSSMIKKTKTHTLNCSIYMLTNSISFYLMLRL